MSGDRLAPPRRTAWLVLVALLLLTLTLRTAVTGLSPLLPRVSAGVPLTPTQAGVVGALPPFCFAAAGLLGPLLLRRLAAERLVLVALALSALGQLVRPWAPGPWPFVAASAVALLGMGTGNVVLPVLVKGWFPGRIAGVTALYVMGLTSGTAVPPLLAVPVADAVQGDTGSQALGWQVSLAWWGVLTVLVALPWLVPAARPRTGPGPAGGPGGGGGASRTTTARARLPLWRSRTAWGVACVFGGNALVSYALFAWLPTRLTDAGVAPATAGAALAAVGAMGIPAALVVPHLAARARSQFWLVAQFVAAFAVGTVGLLVSPATATFAWVVLAGWGSGGFSLALTLVGLRSRTPASAGSLSGFAQGLGYLFAGLGPILVGALREATGGWTVPFGVLLAALLVMLLGGWLAAAPRTVEDDLGLREAAPATLNR